MTSAADRYARAGVNLAVADSLKVKIGELVESTRGPQVLSNRGGFGGLFDVAALPEKNPVLVASTDGVGTKLKLAVAVGRYRGVGHDIVNHCVNDILVCGARPLFFLDYLGFGRLDPVVAPEVVAGIAEACRVAGCALLGGETAEMPGVYSEGDFDLVGTIVGVVARESILDGRRVRPGQTLLGLPSSGLHTNGYSLARRIVAEAGLSLDEPIAGDARPLAEILLAPHRSYLGELRPLLQEHRVCALAHITGGGFEGNVSRVLPSGVGVDIDAASWTPPPIFALLARLGGVSQAEMHRVFNMGVGMVVIVEESEAARCLAALPGSRVIGHTNADGGVRVRF
ncbi:phosphoribosylformylglycinamidine cyclo-ligase [bacterium]|nr:phosphoribosylformylglycinamidine cyclo-ligase [bacterium]